MRRSVALILLLLAGVGACSRVEQEVVSSLFRSYLRAQQALASDDLPAAVQAFDGLEDTASGQVRQVVQALAEAPDLEVARSRFKELSDQLVKMELPEGLVVVHCPMADEGRGARWVQQDGNVTNPYFGAAMLECGEIQRD